MENDLKLRRPERKTTSKRDNLKGKGPQWKKKTSMLGNPNGGQPQWKTALMEEDNNMGNC